MPRFVILKHDTPPNYERPLHWDLMLEAGDSLHTWALEEEPRAGKSIVAWALADHRLHYLDFEGPLEGDRGTVERFDAGDYTLVARDDSSIVANLAGSRLSCRLTLHRESAIEGMVEEPTHHHQRWLAVFEAG